MASPSSPAKHEPAGEAGVPLAEELRRLAREVESGGIRLVLVTAIRRDGTIEHLDETYCAYPLPG